MGRTMTTWVMVLVVASLLGVLTGCGDGTTKASDGATAPQAATTQQDAESTDATAEEASELRAPPTDAAGVQAWMGKAYPDAAWLGHIKKVEHVPGEVPDSGGFKNAVVVTTDLDFASEQALGTEIQGALGEANLAWAKQYVVKFADGRNIMAGDLIDPTP